MLVGVIVAAITAWIIYKKQGPTNTTNISGKGAQQNIADQNSSITNTQRDTIITSDQAEVSITNINGFEPNLLLHHYSQAQQTIGRQGYQLEQLTLENKEIKEQYDKAVKRIEELESQGNIAAAEAIKQLRESGDTGKLLAFLIKEREINKESFIELNREIAAVAYLRGDIEIADNAVDEILKLDPNDLFALNQKGAVHSLQGRLDAAIKSYERVLELARQQQNLEWQAPALGNLSVVYQTRGDLDKAEEMHKKALNIDKQMDSKKGVAEDYGNLGIVYQIRGDFDNAEDMYKKALAIFEQLGSLEGKAIQYGNLGIVYKTKGDLDKAEEMYQKALEINQQIGRLKGQANQYGNLGNIYFTRGDLDNAEKMYREVLKIEEKLGRPHSIANAYGNLGSVYLTKGDLENAEHMYKKALDLSKQLGSKQGQANQYGNLGIIYRTRGDKAKAKEYWQNALDLYKQVGIGHMTEKIQSWLDTLDKK